MLDLEGKVAAVTGGASGIGLGIAKALHAEGARVALCYRNPDRLEVALSAFDGSDRVLALPLDVTDRASVAKAADSLESAWGKVHILCNSAGVSLFGPMDKATPQDWQWVFDVNFFGVINCIQEFLPRIKSHGEGGYVVNVASMSSFISGAEAGVYSTSKFALRGLTECLRYTLAPQGIGVSMLSPGLTKSNIHEAAMRRPAHLSDTGLPVSPEMTKVIEAVHATGMSADEVGVAAVKGMLRNDLYVFTHPEFRTDLEEAFAELLSAVPPGEATADRLRIETMRRKNKATAEAAARAIRMEGVQALDTARLGASVPTEA